MLIAATVPSYCSRFFVVCLVGMRFHRHSATTLNTFIDSIRQLLCSFKDLIRKLWSLIKEIISCLDFTSSHIQTRDSWVGSANATSVLFHLLSIRPCKCDFAYFYFSVLSDPCPICWKVPKGLKNWRVFVAGLNETECLPSCSSNCLLFSLLIYSFLVHTKRK